MHVKNFGAMVGFVSLLATGGCVADADQETMGEDLGVATQKLVTSCPFSQPVTPIDPSKELVIRSRSVVDDPCRTSWTAVGCSSRLGKWTFGWLMTTMAGATSPLDVNARKFVADWLNRWETNQVVNGLTVMSRGKIREKFIGPWLKKSSCAVGAPLTGPGACLPDLTVAPFRLLAIVNRVDMSGVDPYTGTGSTGELRFVFGALNADLVSPSDTLQATVILEFKLPTSKSGPQWATLLHGLSAQPLPSLPTVAPATTPFNDSLQAITDQVTGPNAQPGNANNGTSIGQVRTNEIDFDPNVNLALRVWEMREHKLSCSPGATVGCPLVPTPTAQTPPTPMNNTSPLNNYLVGNASVIEADKHIVPASLLGGSSLSSQGGSATVWSNPNPATVSVLSRHLFGFETCNGCHYQETANTNRFHVAPRSAVAMANLSPFLSQPITSSDGGARPDSFLLVSDPDLSTGMLFEYNEPWRRACEVRRLLSGNTNPFSRPSGAL